MLADPLFIVSLFAVPIALAAVAMVFRRGRLISADPWYGAPLVPRIRAGRSGTGGQEEAARTEPTEGARVDAVALCEKVLFCWDFWRRGKSGVHLEDVFAARDLPAEIRAALDDARSRGRAPSE